MTLRTSTLALQETGKGLRLEMVVLDMLCVGSQGMSTMGNPRSVHSNTFVSETLKSLYAFSYPYSVVFQPSYIFVDLSSVPARPRFAL